MANIVHGVNGSGKTSLLEAIHLLGRGRSFRHRDLRLVVSHEADELVVSAKVNKTDPLKTHQLGVRRSSSGQFAARLDGKTIQTAAQLATVLPLQLIDAQSFNLLEGGPLQRRQFLDWGVFHVEQSYSQLWGRFQKTLKQRNQLLRHGRIDADSLRAWTTELAPLGEQISTYRKRYIEGLIPHIEAVAREFDGLGSLDIEYYQGWSDEVSLSEAMALDNKRDLAVGTTSHGAHKADMRVKVGGAPAADVLSRGQTKLLVYALKLAQATYFRDQAGESCVFLLDDLPAELDYHHRQQVVSCLYGLNCQFFVTGVDKKDFDVLVKDNAHQMFHMEHGALTVG
jgi:DNA replication and repair protein RecF